MGKENSNARIDVKRICELAHFDMSREEMDEYQEQLNRVLSYVDMLGRLNLDGIEPTTYGQPVANRFREDIAAPCLSHETVMKNAPESSKGEIKVPKVVE